MTEAKDIVGHLKTCIDIAQKLDDHIKKLVQELAIVGPSHNTIKAQLLNAGFGKELTNEDNLKLLLDHHTNLVAENTRLNKIITDRDALMEQLREVVLDGGDS